MTSQNQSLSFEDFEHLADRMLEQALDRSLLTNTPVGAVLAAVIFHLSLDAQLNDVPEAMLQMVVAEAGESFRLAETEQLVAEATQ